MFRANGGCGYVKKPVFLTQKGPPVKTILKPNTFSPPDFYTKVYIVGVLADPCKKKTKIINDDWAPVWDEEIEVREYDRSEKDDFGGQICLPISELKYGNNESIKLHSQTYRLSYICL
ncbi:hypothetical protein UlMin_025369 [Ulmus minor]